MSDHTPTTEEVRNHYAYGCGPEHTWPEAREDFDRWLAAHDAEKRSEWEAERRAGAMSIDIEALREKAERATPGPWEVSETHDGTTLRFSRPYPEYKATDGRVEYLSMGPANAEFIAAANPQVALALLDALEQTAAERDRYRKAIEEARVLVSAGVRADPDRVLAILIAALQNGESNECGGELVTNRPDGSGE